MLNARPANGGSPEGWEASRKRRTPRVFNSSERFQRLPSHGLMTPRRTRAQAASSLTARSRSRGRSLP
eukprot:6147962-Prymnesium_polylepis.1